MGGKIGRFDAVKRKTNTSGHTGVYYIKATQKYQAAITFNYRLFSLGMYADIEDAVRAREEANTHIKEGDFIEWYERVHPKQYACFLEDRIITINEGDFPFNSQDEVKEFCEQGDWGDYDDCYSSLELAEGTDIQLTVKFETPDGDFIAEMSEWVSELQKED